jgi:hypothetical protein
VPIATVSPIAALQIRLLRTPHLPTNAQNFPIAIDGVHSPRVSRKAVKFRI